MGVQLGYRHPVFGICRVQKRFGRQNVGPAAGQFGRQCYWQGCWQLEFFQREIRHLGCTRSLSGEGSQEMLVLFKLLAQQGQTGPGLFDLRLQSQKFVWRRLTETHPVAGDVDLLILCLEDGLRGCDLAGKFCPCDGGCGDVGCKSQMCARQFMAAMVGAGGQRLQRAAIASGQVEPVMHANAGVV